MHFAFPQSLDFLHSVTLGPVGEQPSEPSAYPYYFSISSAKELLPVLLKQGRYFLEAGPRAILENALEDMYTEEADFTVNVTTASAYDGSLPEILAAALEQRFFLSKSQRMPLITCMHEAITNAVFHGNLNLGAITDPAGFQAYYDTAALLIRQDPCKNRRITITAWYENARLTLSVRDEGKGFPPGGIPELNPSPGHVSGRGLFFIRSLAEEVWIGRDNKTLFMTFKH